MEELKLYTLEEVENEIIGPVGTPERDQYEMDLENELYAYKLGETIRKARISQNLTQEQLGEKVGIRKSQISKLEHGKSISLLSMTRIFKAMGIPLTLEVGNIGRLSL